MKKVSVPYGLLVVLLVLVFGLVGCGGSNQQQSPTATETSVPVAPFEGRMQVDSYATVEFLMGAVYSDSEGYLEKNLHLSNYGGEFYQNAFALVDGNTTAEQAAGKTIGVLTSEWLTHNIHGYNMAGQTCEFKKFQVVKEDGYVVKFNYTASLNSPDLLADCESAAKSTITYQNKSLSNYFSARGASISAFFLKIEKDGDNYFLNVKEVVLPAKIVVTPP